ncbi:MAG TPA: TetR/AcrR family transcriptional regulator [Candidatus Thermoplasmatota archaeon]|nr:TetR/AcrR family transcriptional regulator [Candidatus Thermoplasmatota archaeon]
MTRIRRRPRAGQRDALLDAAFATLARTGDTRPEDVAREAGASKALIFHHFRNLQGLHDAMVERVLRETQAGLDALAAEAPGPRDRLAALARALLGEPPEPPAQARRVMRFWFADDERGRLRDGLVSDFVEKTLRELRARVDARVVASLLLARWHGATAVYANGGAIDFDAEAERALAELDGLF